MRPQFFLGIVLAALGGCLVTLYKDPKPAVPAALTTPAAGSNPTAPAAR
jgi:hypothetical protein